MFIQTLLLQAPPPLVAFQLPLDWSTGLPLQISVRTDLLFRRNCPYPAVFTAATCIIGECRATSCDIHVTQMSIKGIVHRFHCVIPSLKYSPDVFSKELSECRWLKCQIVSFTRRSLEFACRFLFAQCLAVVSKPRRPLIKTSLHPLAMFPAAVTGAFPILPLSLPAL